MPNQLYKSTEGTENSSSITNVSYTNAVTTAHNDNITTKVTQTTTASVCVSSSVVFNQLYSRRKATGYTIQHIPVPAEVTFQPLPQPKPVLNLATPEGCKAELS